MSKKENKNEAEQQLEVEPIVKPEDEMPDNKNVTIPVPTAKEIKEYLDKYIVGQEHTKRVLSVAVHNHYRRIQAKYEKPNESIEKKFANVEIEKSNILLTGPTGSGKTLFAKTLARMLGVPFAIADATTLTQAGYVGEDVENIVRYLWQNANYNIGMAQIGIVYVDEIDKIASKTDNVSITRDVSGEGVQQALLKIVEGTTCRFPPNGGRKHPDQPLVEVDTSDILFICGGAFVGLDKIIKNRTDAKTIGYVKDTAENKEIENVLPEDLVKFGLIPEFIGRLPVVSQLKELTEDDLVKIMTEPNNAITKQYQKLLAYDGVDIEFAEDAIRMIAKAAVEKKTGARGLRSEIEKIMTDVMFNIDEIGSKKIIDAEFIEKMAA